jgi:hypothetical protein
VPVQVMQVRQVPVQVMQVRQVPVQVQVPFQAAFLVLELEY